MQRLLSNQRPMKGVTLVLYWIAQISEKVMPPRRIGYPRSVVHVSPKYFSDDSMIGGGERYPTALAEAMANYVDIVMISFGPHRRSLKQGKLRIEIYPAIENPYTPIFLGFYRLSFLQELAKADVIHCHQYYTFVSNVVIPLGAALRRRIFVTDEGGGGSYVTQKVPLDNLINGLLPISKFSTKFLPSIKQTQIIYGGVSKKFIQDKQEREREKKVLFVGRILPHKGINYLIEAIDEKIPLEIIGRVYNQSYFALLKELAKTKKVTFINNANDQNLIEAYSSASVTVLPSVYTDVNLNEHPNSELLGLVLLESMACATPVICTNVGAMPEIVIDGVTGFVVPPNDSIALRERINWLLENPEKARQMGKKGRERVLQEFTWDKVAQQCLEAYAKN